MFDPANVPQSRRYYKFQISGWTDFDPMEKQFSELTRAIEDGGGVLTAMEVVDVAEDLSAIRDQEVKQRFENILAAKKLLRNIGELPKKLADDLRSALTAQEETVAKKPVAYAQSQPPPVLKKA